MRVVFRINTLTQEKKVIEETKKFLSFYNENKYLITFPEKPLEKEYIKKSFRIEKIKKDWQKIEKHFFNKLSNLFNTNNSLVFEVFFTKYGVGGSYKTPNKIIININDKYNHLVSHKTIAHEILHLMTERYIRKNKIDHKSKEIIVDFIENEIFKGIY